MSHSRKHVKNAVLQEYPEPRENEVIVRVLELKGANICDVELDTGETVLVSIPSKFNKMIWISRGSYLIIEKFSASEHATAKVRGQVVAVLFEDQVDHLKSRNFWPQKFAQIESLKETEKKGSSSSNPKKSKPAAAEDEDGLGSEGDSMDDLPGNPNRMGGQASSDDDSD